MIPKKIAWIMKSFSFRYFFFSWCVVGRIQIGSFRSTFIVVGHPFSLSLDFLFTSQADLVLSTSVGPNNKNKNINNEIKFWSKK